MDMKINFLPAKTWNWLRMNETEVKQVKADRQALEKEEIPETFAVEASTLEPIKTGMGPDMDKLAEQSGCGKSLPDACRHKRGSCAASWLCL